MQQQSSLLKRLLYLIRPHIKLTILGFIGLAIGSGITLLFPYLIGQALDGAYGELSSNRLLTLVGSLILLFAIQSSFFYLRHYAFWVVGYRIGIDLRSKLFQSTLEQDVAFFDSAKTGDLISRLNADVQIVQRVMTANVSIAVRYLLQVIVGTLLLIYLSPRLSMVILLLLPLLALSAFFWGRKLRTLSKQIQQALGDSSVIAEESIGFSRTVRAFAAEKRIANRYKQTLESVLSLSINRTKAAALFSSVTVFFIHSSIAIILWYGYTLIQANSLQVGELVAFILYCLIVAVSVGFLANIWDEFMQAVGASERIFEIIDTKPTILDPLTPHNLAQHSAGKLEFKQVYFSYPSRADIQVLNNLSFTINAGETVALVGPSGAGKSTIAALTLKHYQPISGEILYCDIPLSLISRTDLLSEIAIVPQEAELFSQSIAENILFGNPSASKAELLSAIETARLADLIEDLPDGLETAVGDRGVQLSGGQKQRVIIARAMLKNPKFLILDEATSALDGENERLLREALTELMRGRTTLIIAHRLSTVQFADRVLVIKNGALIQQGTHHSLIDEPGLYRTLVAEQLL